MLTDRITAQHLRRAAIVYVRQSSPEQVRSHAESTRIQIGLRDKAVAFSWLGLARAAGGRVTDIRRVPEALDTGAGTGANGDAALDG